MLVETIKSRIVTAMKSKNDRERDVLRFVVSELQRSNLDKPSDEQVVKVIKKTIENNGVTLNVCPQTDPRFTSLTEENTILTAVVVKGANPPINFSFSNKDPN